jgi:ABC-2 type transport system permease protein
MRRVVQVAVREFVVTVSNRAFVVGLLVMPALIAAFATLVPRLFTARDYKVEGHIRIIDSTGLVTPQLRTTMDARQIAARRVDQAQRALANAPATVREFAGNRGNQAIQQALGPIPDLRLEERPATADLQEEKAWLTEKDAGLPHLALVVIHPNAVLPANGELEYGTYDLYVPSNLDDRADGEIQQSLREALINARGEAQSLNRAKINAIIQVPRVRSVTVTQGNERETVRGFNIALPVSVAALLFIGVMTGGQALLTSTVEEKSNRVIEVLLSAVSPMELMAGKLIGQMAVSLLVLSLYIAMGLTVLTSLSLFGLFNPWLIFYVFIFFVIMYLVFGSLMMAIGSAVNEMREAQGLMMPLMLILMIPWILWFPISRNPDSLVSVTLSFLPPVNTFGMLLRMASNTPPPWWQVWLSIAIGVGSAFVAIWFAAKVFRIGLLMYGKPPNIATLIRWARSA